MDSSELAKFLVKLAAVILIVATNGFFVASEFALVSVRQSRIVALAAEGNRRARVLLRLLDNLSAYISAIQFGVTLASLALGWIGENTIAQILEPLFLRSLPASATTVAAHSAAFAVAFACITYLHIVLGELVPKAVALARTERVALVIALPIHLFYRAFKAPIRLLNFSGVTVLRWLGLQAATKSSAAYSEEELRQLIAISHKSGKVLEDERQLIDNVFDFTDATVESVMIPRTEIEAIDADLTPEQMLDRFEQLEYSRMPVFHGALDNIIGILLYKDLSRMVRRGGPIRVEQIIRPAVFLPDTMKLNDALRTLRRTRDHLALVVDEHGGVEGLVTLEDLLEEIVGDISDEHDEGAARQVVEQPDGTYTVNGNLSIRDANKQLDLGLPESDNYHTIAGFMMARAGRILREGESVEYNGLRLTVKASTRHRIVEARVERVENPEAVVKG